jgi:hypothetical protein
MSKWEAVMIGLGATEQLVIQFIIIFAIFLAPVVLLLTLFFRINDRLKNIETMLKQKKDLS